MPSVQKRGDTYRIMVSQGYDIYGKQIRKNTTFTPPEGVTEGKADKLAMAYAYEFEKHCEGMVNMNENIRFSELATWYYEQIAVHKLKPATYANNRELMNLYVLPYIGNMKLKDINTARIDALFNELYRDGRKRETYKLRDVATLEYGTRRPLARKSGVNMNTLRTLGNGETVLKETAVRISEALGVKLKDIFTVEEVGGSLDVGTIKRIRTALSPIFSTAVKKELLLKNPVTNATTPAGEEKERVYLDAEQCKELMTFLDEFTNPQLPRVIKALLYTGMRVGELTALHWDEVDLDRAMLTVKYNLYRLGEEYRLTTPKTKSSARVIALPPQLVETLREQKEWQDERRKAVGKRWIDRGAVFTGSYGEYMAKSYINLQFKQLLAKHDFPDVHIHDLRHANASLLINMGVPVKVISEHLGHRDTRTTETIYAHVFAETMKQASDAISTALATADV
nr:MAG TPA: Integrase [Caudoviricetes sp.]